MTGASSGEDRAAGLRPQPASPFSQSSIPSARCIIDLYPAFAVPVDYRGPLAREFHDLVARKWLEGMCGGHTSPVAPERLPDLVRAHLSMNWQIDNGLSYPRRGLDNFHIVDWLLDRWVALKRPFKPNPYAQAIEAATAGETREAGLDAKHESAVAKPCAPTQEPNS